MRRNIPIAMLAIFMLACLSDVSVLRAQEGKLREQEMALNLELQIEQNKLKSVERRTRDLIRQLDGP